MVLELFVANLISIHTPPCLLNFCIPVSFLSLLHAKVIPIFSLVNLFPLPVFCMADTFSIPGPLYKAPLFSPLPM